MHRREKSAIQSHRREIVDDLFLEEDLLAKMMREKLFTTGMIEDIKSQKTMRDKTHRLLELLLKRGPDAFSKFCAILSEDYKWLAERLNETYKEKLADEEAEIVDSARTPRQLQLSFPPTPRETFPKRLMSTTSSRRNVQDGYSRNSTAFFHESFGQTIDETDGQPGNLIEDRQTHLLEDFEMRQKADACVSPIQTLSPSRRYIHTASSPFPLERRITNDNYDLDDEDDEDDSEEENTDEILQQVPNILNEMDEEDAQITGTEGLETTDIDNDGNETDEDKILEELFLKLYKINTENETETEVHTEQEIGKVTLAMVHEEIDKLVKRVDNAETSLDQVFDALGEPDTKIPIDVYIQKLLEKKDELAQQLDKEKREKDSMVNDMYTEMKHINTLKHKNEKFETEIKELKEQMQQTKLEGERKVTELQKRLDEVVERERTQAILLQQQQSPQTVRRRTSKSFFSSTPRRTQPTSVYQHSSFELFPPRSKFTYKKK